LQSEINEISHFQEKNERRDGVITAFDPFHFSIDAISLKWTIAWFELELKIFICRIGERYD